MSKEIIDKTLNLIKSGSYQEAENFLKENLEIDKKNQKFLNLLGYVKILDRKFDDAINIFEELVKIDSSFIEGWINLGSTQQILKKYDKAIESYNKVISQKPDHVLALVNQGIAFAQLKKYNLALINHEKAIKINNNNYEAWLNKGVALKGLLRHEEAIGSYEKAINLKPDHYVGWLNQGTAYIKLKKYEEAIKAFRKARELNSNLPEIAHGEGLAKLTLGDFEDGFKKFENRWNLKDFEELRHQSIPLWTGQESIEGKRILVWTEQGFGDTFQFCRYILNLLEKKAEVVFEVKSRIKNLAQCISEKIKVIKYGETFPTCNYQIPLLSLPLAFNTKLDNIPKKIPYFKINKNLIEHWNANVTNNKKPKIGLAWSTGSKYRSAKEKSINIDLLSPIISNEFNFFSIQKDLTKEEKIFLSKNKITHFGEEDFLNTAAIIKNLDLVISIDTSIAHLSGAINMPTWILLSYSPDWRWLVDRNDSPWYPSVKIFRQNNQGDWSNVILSVKKELKNLQH